MTQPTRAQIEAALFAISPSSLSVADMKAALTAAAEAEEQHKNWDAYTASLEDGKAATIERCAQVAEECTANGEAIAKGIAAEIRALKDKP